LIANKKEKEKVMAKRNGGLTVLNWKPTPIKQKKKKK
jgi:hypothetical protein